MADMRDTNSIGAVTEGRVLGALLHAGYTVALPFGVARYDLVLDTPDGLKRVQCKTGQLASGAVRFRVYSVNRHADGHYGKTSYQGAADLFGVYCPQNDKVYLVPVDGNTSDISLRVDAPKNNQTSRMRLASDYEVRSPNVRT
jgi:hypothetical protein